MEIAGIIRELRSIRNFSQEYMADELGINTSSYGRIERGISDLTVGRLQAIAAIFNMSLVELITYGSVQNETMVSPGGVPITPAYVAHLEEEVAFLRTLLNGDHGNSKGLDIPGFMPWAGRAVS